MGEWWSIEVADGEFSATSWKDTHGRDLIRTALEYGAEDWAWVERPWGVVLELCFPEDSPVGGWPAFRDATLVKAALDAVPDPINGLLMYPGRGGSSGARPAQTEAGTRRGGRGVAGTRCPRRGDPAGFDGGGGTGADGPRAACVSGLRTRGPEGLSRAGHLRALRSLISAVADRAKPAAAANSCDTKRFGASS